MGSTKQTQMDIVLDIVKQYEPIRTEQIKIIAMKHGVSCPDRYLRWLARAGKVVSFKPERKDGRKDATKTWMLSIFA